MSDSLRCDANVQDCVLVTRGFAEARGQDLATLAVVEEELRQCREALLK